MKKIEKLAKAAMRKNFTENYGIDVSISNEGDEDENVFISVSKLIDLDVKISMNDLIEKVSSHSYEIGMDGDMQGDIDVEHNDTATICFHDSTSVTISIDTQIHANNIEGMSETEIATLIDEKTNGLASDMQEAIAKVKQACNSL